ncbi:unnamed protein product [Sphagnum jensenii]|uniref:Protein kinase domain-containing protein n=1 Tax=Sphagnum jensenii TaxID=128206 RepID=A0ABP0VUA2_9BRYO
MVFKGCMETLDLWARTLGLQRVQLGFGLSSIDSSVAETLFKECQDVAMTVSLRCEQVRFNNSLCSLLATTYSSSLRRDFDFRKTHECEIILAELKRVLLCGEMLVAQWTDENWWKSMVNSSDSASIQERVLLHLNELLFCVEELNLITSESVPPDYTFFKSDVLNLLTPDVEAASARDIESLFRTIEGYTRTSVLQGDAMKLAEYVLDKFRAANSNHGRVEYDDVQLGDFLGNGSFGSVFKCQFLGMMAAVKVFRTSSRWTAKAVENEANLQARSTNSDRGHLHLIAFDDVHRGKECLGNGSFGSVFKCQCHGEIAAVKIFLTSNITEVKAVENEVSLLARLQHPNVVRFIGYAFKGREHFIVTELMSMDLRRPTLPPEDSCPGHLSAFIKECWATRPKDRPKFPEICQMLQECKGMILSHSSPHPSLQNSEPRKHRNDGDYTRSILATDNSEKLFQGSGRMVDVSGGRFRATNPDHGLLHLMEYEDVCIGKECLGIGAFGVVFKCTFHGKMAAAQIMLTSNIPEVEAVENEVNIRARLQHPNVVQFIGYAIKGSQHVIVMELMSKDLRAYLHENVHDGQTIPQLVAIDIMLQLAEAMTYLHESGVMHRDLNPENVLVNVPETEDSHLLSSVQAKITGFGMSKLNLNNSRFTTRQVGKAQWRAPEVFEDEQNTEKYTKAADVYSFAMVFFEVLTGEVPFANIQKNQLLPRIRDGERPTLPPEDCCAAHLSAVIKKCWATRAEDRPKFVEICQMLVSCKDLILSHSSTNPSSQSSKS